MQPFKNLRISPTTYLEQQVTVFFILTRFVAVFLSLPCVTDVPLYFYIFKNLNLSLVPYSQFNFEYPPLTLIPIYLSGVMVDSDNWLMYHSYFAIILFFLDFFCLKICKNYCKNRLSMGDREIAYMTLLYSLFGFLLFRILYHRLDIIVALFLVTSLILFQKKNPKLTPLFFFNAFLGFFYKIIPAFVMPPAILLKAFSSSSDIKKILLKILLNSVAFISLLAAAIFALEIYTDHHFIKNMLVHQQRGIQIESSYGSFLMFKDLLLNQKSIIYHAYGSHNIYANPALEKIARHLGNIVLLCFYLSLFLKLLKERKSEKKVQISEEIFLNVLMITTLLFLTFQRVLSTQFFIWLIPLAAIWLAKNRSIFFLLAFSFLFFTTFAIFSIEYFALVTQIPIMVTTLFLRNLLLLVITLLMTAKFFTSELRK